MMMLAYCDNGCYWFDNKNQFTKVGEKKNYITKIGQWLVVIMVAIGLTTITNLTKVEAIVVTLVGPNA